MVKWVYVLIFELDDDIGKYLVKELDEKDGGVTTFYCEYLRYHKPVPGDTVMITAFEEVGV